MVIKSLLSNLLILILLTGCSEANVKKVVIYRNKDIYTVSDQKKLEAIGNAISDFTKNIDDILKVILTPSQIHEVINNEYGVEIQYSDKQKVQNSNSNYPISFSKIYIPLSGKYSKFGIVYFFGDDEGYGSFPPYVTNEGLNELKTLIKAIEH